MASNHVAVITVRRDACLDGVTNMALDCAILDGAEKGRPGCRVYGWRGPWVSLGKQQKAERDLIDPSLVPWVVRPTGGKAVLHGHDVTVGLALPLSIVAESMRPATADPSHLSRSVRTVYRVIARPLVGALQACGLEVALAEDTDFSRRGKPSADCFAYISPNDIVNVRTGHKACGCALRLTSTAVLVQASIPNGRPAIDPVRLFATSQSNPEIKWDDTHFAEALEIQLCGLLGRY